MNFKVEDFFKKNYAFLCLVSFSIVKDEDVAKDIVQDFFVSFWNKKEYVAITSSMDAYAKKAVKNLSLQYILKKQRELNLLDSLKFENQPTDQVVDIRNLNKLNDLVDQLPHKRKEIFVSAIVHGRSYSEIAEANKISVNTVKTQIKRAYAFLRTFKKEDYISLIILVNLIEVLIH
ncbi:sigma-70 family RNA polymerase sigma factor [Allomuricauda sp. XS_ASV26]|uniref:RNA polymerase sigma-70 factor n=1 Tax=Flagellimonas marinaquae TaxID=254955 RepID=A0AA48KN02_9FLAO|nr:sigma-70 family RNA polymerase sigma factor [Allomuricauda ruestringensis]MCA0957411.1 sigma-70 family RNA polymerase sigma factor [Allomuricauda ruestringensis]BDW93664.1 RNA polymerase sigma-70 factor [Allomuricauda aquimarina]